MHAERLLPVPDAAQVPVVFAVRLASAPAGLLRALPLYRAEEAAGPQLRDPFGGWWAAGEDPGPEAATLTTHWFCDAGATPTSTCSTPCSPGGRRSGSSYGE